MNRIAKIFIVLIAALVLTTKPSLAIPSGIPSQECFTISAPVPGDMCYVVHENLGVKAYAKGNTRRGHLTFQPTSPDYFIVAAKKEITSKTGDSQVKKSFLEKGSTLKRETEFKEKTEELDKTINELKLKIAGSVGVAKAELENKLSHLKEVKRQTEKRYKSFLEASKDAQVVEYEWEAHPRKCGWGNLDRCGSWIFFNVYEVRRYF